jgi:hypothetical protein
MSLVNCPGEHGTGCRHGCSCGHSWSCAVFHPRRSSGLWTGDEALRTGTRSTGKCGGQGFESPQLHSSDQRLCRSGRLLDSNDGAVSPLIVRMIFTCGPGGGVQTVGDGVVEEARVDVEGHSRAGVPEHALDGLHVGSGGDAGGVGGGGSDSFEIAFMQGVVGGDEFYITMQCGMEEAAEELGVEVRRRVPSSSTPRCRVRSISPRLLSTPTLVFSRTGS